jgi:hypothetical protein
MIHRRQQEIILWLRSVRGGPKISSKSVECGGCMDVCFCINCSDLSHWMRDDRKR